MASGIRYAFRPKGAQRKEDTTPKKGIRRYLFELKEGNKQFWLSGHAVTKLITLVYWIGIEVLLGWERTSEIGESACSRSRVLIFQW